LLQQKSNGRVWIVYKDDTDASGRWGKIVVKRRGANVADGWTTISSDLIGVDVWHLAVSQDKTGGQIFIAYIKNDGTDLRGRTIYYVILNTTTGAVSAEQKLADIRGAYTVDCLVLPPVVLGETMPLLWSEHDGTIVGGTGTAGHTWWLAATATVPVNGTPFDPPIFNPPIFNPGVFG
jgi:hypothetical protein